jgi:competence ComEA-like helix-hairpin-helix protein
MTRQERQAVVFLLIVFTVGLLFFSIRRFHFYRIYVRQMDRPAVVHQSELKESGFSTDIEERDENPIEPVHVNSADVAALVLLPGVGRETALRIIEYRSTVGPFTRISDLLNVRGIGEKKLEKMRKHVVLD